MKGKINEAQLLLDIENFLKKLKRRRKVWSEFYENLADLLIDFDQIYNPDYEYIGYVRFFVVLYYDLTDIELGYDALIEELERIGFAELKYSFVEEYNCFEHDYEIIEDQKKENKSELRKYSRQISDAYSRILVVRVDLGYLQEFHSRINIDDLYFDLDMLVNRIQNKDGIFKHVIGYAWGLEQGGKSKGYHCHLAVIYDTVHRAGTARYWGDKIIKLWNDITRDYGQGYNCYNRERVAELSAKDKLGIGLIYRRDADQVENFLKAMSYLTEHAKRTNQYLRVKPNGRRVFGKGQLRSTQRRRELN